MSFLELSQIKKTYPNSVKPCIDCLDLQVEKGEIVVILGPSGCGKTTVLKIIAGLESYDEGSVMIDGEDMKKIRTENRPISMVFQKPLLFRNQTVKNNINFSPRVKANMRREEMDRRTSELITLMELEGLEDRKPGQLSGGQEQRVSLARALMTNPKILLLDEPFSALDAKLRVSMRENLRKIFKSIGQTVIFVTHDQQEAVAMGDRIALMANGKIVQVDRPEVFYHRPQTKGTAVFFGWKNAIPAEQKGGKIISPIGEFEIPCVEPCDRDAILMVHPQAAICKEDGELTGKVIEATYLGTVSDYIVECNGVQMSIQLNCRNMFIQGEEIRFDLDRTMMWPVEDEPEQIEEIPEKKKGLFGKKKIEENNEEGT